MVLLFYTKITAHPLLKAYVPQHLHVSWILHMKVHRSLRQKSGHGLLKQEKKFRSNELCQFHKIKSKNRKIFWWARVELNPAQRFYVFYLLFCGTDMFLLEKLTFLF